MEVQESHPASVHLHQSPPPPPPPPPPSSARHSGCRSVEGALGLQQQVSLQAWWKRQPRHAAVTAPPQAAADGAAAEVHQAAGGGGADGEERLVEVGVALRRHDERLDYSSDNKTV